MTADGEKEIQQLKNRFRDLADRAYTRGMFTFSGFLGLSGQDVLLQLKRELDYVPWQLWGGCEEADRKMVRFGSAEELGYEQPYPIVCIHILPPTPKFSEELSHRDFLGALMNLGIDRATLGDIRVGEREAYLFCQESVSGVVCESLEQVKRTRVKCAQVREMKELPREEPEQCSIQVSSERLDALIAKVYGQSRSSALALIGSGRVYVNGRQSMENSKPVSKGDVINVRGFGKFIYSGVSYETKKGKLNVIVSIFR